MKDLCPLCRAKGTLIDNQLNRILVCENQSCDIVSYRETGITAL